MQILYLDLLEVLLQFVKVLRCLIRQGTQALSLPHIGRHRGLVLATCLALRVLVSVSVDHFAGRVNLAPPLIRHVTKIVIINVTLAPLVQITKNLLLLLDRDFQFNRLQTFGKFVERYLVVEVNVEEPKCCTQRLEPITDSTPHQLKVPPQLDTLSGCPLFHRGRLIL